MDRYDDFAQMITDTPTKFDQAAHTVLERLQVSLAFDIEAVHDVLENLRQSLSSRDSDGDVPATRCVVIDSITPLLGPMLSATSSQGMHTIYLPKRQTAADLMFARQDTPS